MSDPAEELRRYQTRKRWGWWLQLLIVLVLSAGVYLMQRAVDHIRTKRERLRAIDELMYFPSGNLLGAVLGEFRPLAADFAWLQVVQYAGSHMNLANQEENYRWVGNAIDVIGTLDPHFVEPCVFGAQILGWDADQPWEGIALLRKGFDQNPMNWELPFQAGFIAYEKLKEKGYNLAGHYFSIAAELPGVWLVARRMAAGAYAKTGDFELTRELWTEVLSEQHNPKVKDIAQRGLIGLEVQELKFLQTAADSFGRIESRVPASLDELREKGYIEEVPREPFDGHYVLSLGRVLSTSVENARIALRNLQRLAERYRSEFHRLPGRIDDLVQAGYLSGVPVEPFGGSFEIEDGKVRTTTDLSTLP